MPINQIDSLGKIIDSLSQQLHDSRISEGYFTALLSIQTAVFLAVIGIGAFIAWSYIFNVIKQSHNKIIAKNITFQKNVNEKIEVFNDKLSKELTDLNKTSNSTTELLYRSMYLINDSTKSHDAAFLWLLRTAHVIVTKELDTKEEIEVYTLSISSLLKEIEESKIKFEEERFNEIEKLLSECISFNESKFKDLFQPLLTNTSKYYYTNLTLPEIPTPKP